MGVLSSGSKVGDYTADRLRLQDDRLQVWDGSDSAGLGVALVVAVVSDPEDAHAFVNAARVFQSAAGEGVGRVLGIGEVGGIPYYVTEAFDGPDLTTVAAAAYERAGRADRVDWASLAALAAAGARAAARCEGAPIALEAGRVLVVGDGIRLVPTTTTTWSLLPAQLGHLLRAVSVAARSKHAGFETLIRRCDQDDEFGSIRSVLPELDRIANGRTLKAAADWAAALLSTTIGPPMLLDGPDGIPLAATGTGEFPTDAAAPLPPVAPAPSAPSQVGSVPGHSSPVEVAAAVPAVTPIVLAQPALGATKRPVVSAVLPAPASGSTNRRIAAGVVGLLLVLLLGLGVVAALVLGLTISGQRGPRDAVSSARPALPSPIPEPVASPPPLPREVAAAEPAPTDAALSAPGVLEPAPGTPPSADGSGERAPGSVPLVVEAAPVRPDPAPPAQVRPESAPPAGREPVDRPAPRLTEVAPAPVVAPQVPPAPEPLAVAAQPVPVLAAATPSPAPPTARSAPSPVPAPNAAPVVAKVPSVFAEPMHARTMYDAQAMLAQVEKAAIAAGASAATVRGSTGALEAQLAGTFPPPEVFVLYPQSMLELLVRESATGASRSALASSIKRLHQQKSR